MDQFARTSSKTNYESFLYQLRKPESHSESWDVFLQAMVDCRLHGCLAIPMLNLCFCFRGGGGVGEELDAKDILPGLSEYNGPTSEDVSDAFTELTLIDGVVMAETSNNST